MKVTPPEKLTSAASNSSVPLIPSNTQLLYLSLSSKVMSITRRYKKTGPVSALQNFKPLNFFQIFLLMQTSKKITSIRPQTFRQQRLCVFYPLLLGIQYILDQGMQILVHNLGHSLFLYGSQIRMGFIFFRAKWKGRRGSNEGRRRSKGEVTETI